MKIKQIKLSPSAISSYKHCPQAFVYSKFRAPYESSLDPSNLSNMDWGTLFHKKLEAYLTDGSLVSFGETDKSLTQIDTRFDEYLSQYSQDLPRVFEIEKTLERPLTDKIILCGTPDMLDRNADTVWDHKTSSSISENSSQIWELFDQFVQYGWLAGWDNGFRVVINEISNAKNPKIKFQRSSFSVSEQDVSEFISRTLHIAEEICETIEKETWALKKARGYACKNFNRLCSFADPCKFRLHMPELFGNIEDKHFSITFEE